MGGDTGCCTVFYGCEEGPADTLDHDIYVFTWGDKTCPTLLDMIQVHDTTCEESMYGCCMVRATCDSYVRLQYPYSIYNVSIDETKFGYVSTGIVKEDINGANCPTQNEVVHNFIEDHYASQEKHSVILVLLMFCIFTTPCCLCKDIIRETIATKWTKWIDAVNCEMYGQFRRVDQETNTVQEENVSEEMVDIDVEKETEYDILP